VAVDYLVPRFNEHRQFFGDTDPRTIDVARSLIELYQKMGKSDAAGPYIAFLAEVRESPFDDLLE
jgi:hypothetical protein